MLLLEGNDRRFIDVGVLSKLPIAGGRSWQASVHPHDPNNRIFSRDLIEVDIYNPSRSRRLFTLFNTHLKSKFNPDNDPRVDEASNLRRECQAATVATIVDRVTRPNSLYVILGDMNDSPDSLPLSPLINSDLNLEDGLADPMETRVFDAGIGDPQDARWTHRFRANGVTTFELFDQIWLSPNLNSRFQGGFIDRRQRAGGDGSDHDPAWVQLDF